MTSSLMACSPPPIVSADTYCVRTRTFDVTPEQVGEMKSKPSIWRPLAVQIKDHDDVRAKNCA